MVVPPDAAAIAATLDAYRRDPLLWKRQSENARRLSAEELNWEQMEARLLALYDELLRSQTPSGPAESLS
jgi:glycosyltransferase involved in cell wall biosynthesis